MGLQRSELEPEVAKALISSKAINFDAVGTIIARCGARTAINGDAIGVNIDHRVMDACITIDPSLPFTAGGLHGLKETQALHEQPGLARPRAFAITPA